MTHHQNARSGMFQPYRLLRPAAVVLATRQSTRSNLLWTALGALILTASGALSLCTATWAQHFSNEKDVVELRLGQRVKVDDGTCPAGQIKEVSGTKMTTDGVVRTRKCIPRIGAKQK